MEKEPDHAACDLPQELRWPEFRTETYHSQVVKVLKTRNVLHYPSIRNNPMLAEMALQRIWGDTIDEHDADLLLEGLIAIDEEIETDVN